MPYITQEQRRDLASYLKDILELVPTLTKGEINYIITRIVATKYAVGSYDWRSEGASVFQDAHDEFYRRVIAPYEDKKKDENGEVYD